MFAVRQKNGEILEMPSSITLSESDRRFFSVFYIPKGTLGEFTASVIMHANKELQNTLYKCVHALVTAGIVEIQSNLIHALGSSGLNALMVFVGGRKSALLENSDLKQHGMSADEAFDMISSELHDTNVTVSKLSREGFGSDSEDDVYLSTEGYHLTNSSPITAIGRALEYLCPGDTGSNIGITYIAENASGDSLPVIAEMCLREAFHSPAIQAKFHKKTRLLEKGCGMFGYKLSVDVEERLFQEEFLEIMFSERTEDVLEKQLHFKDTIADLLGEPGFDIVPNLFNGCETVDDIRSLWGRYESVITVLISFIRHDPTEPLYGAMSLEQSDAISEKCREFEKELINRLTV